MFYTIKSKAQQSWYNWSWLYLFLIHMEIIIIIFLLSVMDIQNNKKKIDIIKKAIYTKQ